MLHNADIVDCLIFLEAEGISDSEILGKLEINRSTLSRWWKENKASPRYLQKMRKWCDTFRPITETYVGKRPPEYLFVEALEAAVEANKDNDDHTYSICAHRMRYKGFYDKGIPPVKSRGRMTAWRSLEYRRPPETDFVIETIRDYHPDEKIRAAYG